MYETTENLYLILQLMKGGTLEAFLNNSVKSGEEISEARVRVILKSIISGIDYFHKMNIVHRDIKPGTFSAYIKKISCLR
jgi:non-specific serine/threonine protein kinase